MLTEAGLDTIGARNKGPPDAEIQGEAGREYGNRGADHFGPHIELKYILCASLMFVLAQSASAALPGDNADGKRLHDASCTGCHDTGLYTRKDRFVRSLDALKKQVEGCSHMAKKELSAVEKQKIIKYLNDQFYQFR